VSWVTWWLDLVCDNTQLRQKNPVIYYPNAKSGPLIQIAGEFWLISGNLQNFTQLALPGSSILNRQRYEKADRFCVGWCRPDPGPFLYGSLRSLFRDRQKPRHFCHAFQGSERL